MDIDDSNIYYGLEQLAEQRRVQEEYPTPEIPHYSLSQQFIPLSLQI